MLSIGREPHCHCKCWIASVHNPGEMQIGFLQTNAVHRVRTGRGALIAQWDWSLLMDSHWVPQCIPICVSHTEQGFTPLKSKPGTQPEASLPCSAQMDPDNSIVLQNYLFPYGGKVPIVILTSLFLPASKGNLKVKCETWLGMDRGMLSSYIYIRSKSLY